jgi:hypothetical protein
MVKNNLNAIVITQTIGKKDLQDAMNSVRRQTYPNILHLIVLMVSSMKKLCRQ